MRVAFIHAIGRMSKTVMGARLAETMVSQLDGVDRLRKTPAPTAQNMFDHLGDFLLAHNDGYHSPGLGT